MTRYGLGGSEIKSWWGWNFAHASRLALQPTQPPVWWVLDLVPGVKQPGHGIDHPHYPPCSAKIKERVELYLYSPFRPSWPAVGWTLPFSMYFEDKRFWNEQEHDCAYHTANLSLLTFLLAKLLLLQILAYFFTYTQFTYLFCIWNLFFVFFTVHGRL
jgi:hypothetical protein